MIRAVIHEQAFIHNLNLINQHTHNTRICLSIKANAYGHGLLTIATLAHKHGIDMLGIARIEEARLLRDCGYTADILLYGIPIIQQYPNIIDYNIRPFIVSLEQAQMLGALAEQAHKQLYLHIKVDTGMHRIGCEPHEVAHIANYIIAHDYLNLEGIATHFPAAENPDYDSFTKKQIIQFNAIVTELHNSDITIPLIHCANSAAVLRFNTALFTMVRPGLMVYGYDPAGLIHNDRDTELKPVMTLEASIIMIKHYEKNTGISYGHTYHTSKKCAIATIDCGYGDGVPHSLSNKLVVRIGAQDFQQVGSICMDQCMIQLPDKHNIKLYDTVSIFGASAAENAISIAQKAHTIPYEILTNIAERVTRIII